VILYDSLMKPRRLPLIGNFAGASHQTGRCRQSSS
jgi:hypothetical protein